MPTPRSLLFPFTAEKSAILNDAAEKSATSTSVPLSSNTSTSDYDEDVTSWKLFFSFVFEALFLLITHISIIV